MSDNKYNGWSNRATWNVMLWLDNEEYLYNKYQTKRKEKGAFTRTSARVFCECVWSDKRTPDNISLRSVNWQEIADAMNEE